MSSSMNFTTAKVDAVEKSVKSNNLELKSTINRNFKKDLYKNSLQVVNHSSVALPSVEQKQ